MLILAIVSTVTVFAGLKWGGMIIWSLISEESDGINENVKEESVKELSDTVSKSDHVYFGSYPQTIYGKKQRIEWRVLAVEDGKALLISEYILDAKPYHSIEREITWQDCTLRKWLNNEFISKAFTAEEQKQIVLKTNQNPDNPTYNALGCEPTEDRVFRLNMVEVKQYFGSDSDCLTKPTAYAKKNGAFVSVDNGNVWWWLRSTSMNYKNAASIVDNDVSDNPLSRYVDEEEGGIHPAILVSLEEYAG